jgi:hypothetical protein
MAAVLTLFGVGVSLLFRHLSQRGAESASQIRFTKARQDIPVIYQDQCITLAFDTDLKDCVYGKKDSDTTIVLFGDSYAAHWFPAINAIAESEGRRLVTFFKAACSPVDAEYIYPRIGRRYTECEQWRQSAFKRIEEMRPALVVVSGSSLYLGEQRLVSPAAWLEGAGRTLGALNKSGARVAYLRSTPAPTIDVVGCLARSAWQAAWRPSSPCTFERAASLDEEVSTAERRIAEASHATYIDMTRYICPDEVCEPERDGTVIYQEGGHLTGQFVTGLIPALRTLLTEASRAAPKSAPF